MKTLLIFEPQSGGHRPAFLRWIAEELKKNPPDSWRVVFVTGIPIPLEESDERIVHQITVESSRRIEVAGRSEKIRILWQLFRDCCARFRPDHVLLLELTYLEMRLAVQGSPCPLSAIVFVQYPHLPAGLKFAVKHCKTALLLRRVSPENLFFLNGETTCAWLDEHFGSRVRFIPLPDPALEAEPQPSFNLRMIFGIPDDRCVFLFPGAISQRKGAPVLLQALSSLSPVAAARSAFVFCGQAEPGYQARFTEDYTRLACHRPDIKLGRLDEFVPDETMAALFLGTDIVLMPYTRPEYSSGILSLAARFGKPVIGPDGGLLARLIRENGLGVVCPVRANSLAACIERATQNPPSVDPVRCSSFVERSRPESFASGILMAICGGG